MMQLPHGQCGNADTALPAVGDNDLAPIVCHLYDPHGFRNSPDSAHVGLHNINVSPIQSTGVIFIDEPLSPHLKVRTALQFFVSIFIRDGADSQKKTRSPICMTREPDLPLIPPKTGESGLLITEPKSG